MLRYVFAVFAMLCAVALGFEFDTGSLEPVHLTAAGIFLAALAAVAP